MILPILLLFLYASYSDIKTLEVPLWLSPAIILLRFFSDEFFGNRDRIFLGIICGFVLFAIFFLISVIGQQLGGADCLIVAAMGYVLDFYGFYAVIIGLLLSIPYTAYMKITNTEHVYPLVPFLTSGFIIMLLMLSVQHNTVLWFI